MIFFDQSNTYFHTTLTYEMVHSMGLKLNFHFALKIAIMPGQWVGELNELGQ